VVAGASYFLCMHTTASDVIRNVTPDFVRSRYDIIQLFSIPMFQKKPLRSRRARFS
jgi:hypothetical protein